MSPCWKEKFEVWYEEWVCLGVWVSECRFACICAFGFFSFAYIYSQQSRYKESIRVLCSPARTHHDWAFCLNWHHHTVAFFSYLSPFPLSLSLPHPFICTIKLFTRVPITLPLNETILKIITPVDYEVAEMNMFSPVWGWTKLYLSVPTGIDKLNLAVCTQRYSFFDLYI